MKKIKTFFNSFFNGKKTAELNNKSDLDKKLVYSLAKSRIPKISQIKYLGKYLSKTEQLVLKGSVGIIILSLAFIGFRFYKKHIETIPVFGGEYVEAVVGIPKKINPLYSSLNDIDGDLGSLVYSSLLKRDNNGNLVNDLARGYEVSKDYKTYTFKIRKNAKWHNGTDLTVDDIMFTFNLIKNPDFNSPLISTFNGVEIEKVDEETIKFSLKESYAPFLELMTFGIMPQELWYGVQPEGMNLAEMNLKPIGSGPYKFKSLTKDQNGLIKSYVLTANDSFYGEKPFIKDLIFNFYPGSEEAISAINENKADGISLFSSDQIDSLVAKNSLNIHQLNFPEMIALFFNQKSGLISSDLNIRKSLASLIDKREITENILSGSAREIKSPILPENFAYNPDLPEIGFSQESAEKILEDSGWKIVDVTADDIKRIKAEKEKDANSVKAEDVAKLDVGEGKWRFKDKFLIVKLTIVDNEDSKRIAQYLKNNWEKSGIKTNIEIISPLEIQSDVIRSKNYEILLYGLFMGHDPDPYAFWHSSQSENKGANFTGYSNKEADKLLEDGRTEIDINKRKDIYYKLQEVIAKDMPADFLYSPFYIYIQGKKVKGNNSINIYSPSDRFAEINKWYVNTGRRYR